MKMISIGNAPCSWGSLEFEGMQGKSIGYAQMLDELVDAGYTGTELGDWGYMPMDVSALRDALTSRKLTMTGAFVPVAFRERAKHADGVARATKIAKQLVAVADAHTPPFVVLADDNGADAIRTKNAGRITQRGLDDSEMRVYAEGVESVARAVKDATGLRCVFHHHCAGFIETPDEIAHLLDHTDASLIGLCFDTGHYAYGSGAPSADVVRDGLRRFGERIWYVHLKDCSASVAAQARAEGLDYFEAVKRGVFCELGKGVVPFADVAQWMRARDYRGFATVEQDVLPGMGAPKLSATRNREYLRSIGL